MMIIKRQSTLYFFLLIYLFTSACSNTDHETGQIDISKSAGGLAIPSVIQTAQLPADGVFTAYIYMDDKQTPEDQQTLAVDATDITFQITVPAGSHTFRVVFDFDDQTWGLFVLASATSDAIDVAANSTQNLSFVDSDYIPLPDDDGDGLTNLEELEAGTDPDNPDTDKPATTATPAGGQYGSVQSVALSCDDGAQGSGCGSSYYTTDPNATTDQFTEYTGTNIDISSNATLRMFSIDNAGNREEVSSENYVIDTDAPTTTATPPGATYVGSQLVKLTCDDGNGAGCVATYFTTDGSTPTVDSGTLYQQPIPITGNTVLRFFSVDNLDNQEIVARQDYFIEGFTKTVAEDNLPVSFTGPFNTNDYNRTQILFGSNQVKGAGYIHSLKLRYDSDVTTNVTCTNTTIKLGQSTVSEISDTFLNNVEQGAGSLFTVFAGTLELNAANAGEYVELILSQPFNYNGVDNLILDVERTSACDANLNLRYENISTYNALVTTDVSAATTGTTSALLSHTKFVFSGGDDNIDFVGSIFSNLYPFGTAQNKVQLLYDSSDIDGAGVINGIGFRIAQDTTQESYIATVVLGHSQLSDLTATFATNYSDTPVTVANAISFTIPSGMTAGSYVWIPFTENNAFEYNGVDNLIVEIAVSSPTGDTNLSYVPVSNGTRVWGAVGDVTGTVDNIGYIAKLRFTGGPINVITGGSVSLTWPVTNFATRTQFLYRSAELGTSGTIAGIRLRVNSNSTQADYSSWQILVGHSTNTALGSSFSGNMIDATTVTVGTFTMSSGSLSGDWFYLIFLNPFTYDGVRNLVIDLSSSGGGDINSYRASDSSPLYTNRHATAPDNTTDTATGFNDNVADIQIVFE